MTGAALLEARGLRRSYPRPGGGARAAVDGVSLDLRPGETLGLAGPSGSGKSTLLRLLLRLEPLEGGDIRFAGLPWSSLSGVELRRQRRAMQAVFQDPVTSLEPRWTVGQIVAEPLRIWSGRDRRRPERVRELLEAVGLPGEAALRRPDQLSGGERQRVAIARALAPGPSLVLCDEPFSALDPSVAGQIESLLLDLQARRGLAYLVVSHDVPALARVSHRVLTMRSGKIVGEARTAGAGNDRRS